MRIHMIGIGGIGMSALAQLYLLEGHAVTGSDREESPTTELLKKKGIDVIIGQRAENLPSGTELVIYSDAVWPDDPERMKTKELGIRELSYFEALGEATKNRMTIAVAGTHGKTTVTAMIAKTLADAGKHPTAIVGSIVRDFGSNFLPGDPDLFVVEACEYKDHILKLSPTFLIITNLEWDHTDWFPSFADLQDTFREAVELVKKEGVIVANLDDQNVAPLLSNAAVPIVNYAKEDVPTLKLIGEFNRDNARAAKAAVRAFAPSIPEEAIDRSLASFGGTWRRFEEKGKTPEGALVFDDYAHHPTAIRETIIAAREGFPDKKLTVVFHPHLYSRTKDLFDGFIEELSKADRVILVPIYPARENPIPGITSDALAEEIKKKNPRTLSLPDFDSIEKELRLHSGSDDLILTMGAGDVYKVADVLVSS